jgi:hypothetical protein
MSYRHLSTERMVQISARWLDPKGLRPELLSIASVTPLVAKIEECHESLISTQTTSSAILARLAAITEEQAALDVVYNRKLRGGITLLSALADLSDEPSKASAYLELRDLLSPEGLRATNKSYAEKAGAAKMLPGRLDDRSKKLVARIPTAEGKLIEAVDAWTEAGHQLGVLEEEKLALNRQLTSSEDGKRPGDVVKARNRWIRLARALETNLEVADADEAAVARILGSLHNAELKAARRAGGAREATPSDDGQPTEAPKQP